MTTLEVLIAARERVAQGWTQGAYARDAQGREVRDRTHPDVACMCALGAILASRALSAQACDAKAALLDSIEDQIPFQAVCTEKAIASWNDAPERTQADVIAAFDRAIAALENER